MKRLIDFLVAVALVPIVLPVCALLVLFVWAETPGMPIFIQKRVGKGKKPFRMFKLRTMQVNTGDIPSQMVDRSKITRVGSFLRRSKLDELPQVFNVLGGSMSFVGPRPCLVTQHELIRERDRRGLFDFLPGVTGPAQIAGVDMSDPALLAQVEAAYFSNSTTLGDLRLMISTALGRGVGDAVLKHASATARKGIDGAPTAQDSK